MNREQNQVAKSDSCIYTRETGKHEWYTLHSTGSECGIGYDFCPNCNYVDIRGTLKRTSFLKILKTYFF